MDSIYCFAGDETSFSDHSASNIDFSKELEYRIRGTDCYSEAMIVDILQMIKNGIIGQWPSEPTHSVCDAYLWMLDSVAEPLHLANGRDLRNLSEVVSSDLLELLLGSRPVMAPKPNCCTNCIIGVADSTAIRQWVCSKLPACNKNFSKLEDELFEILESVARDGTCVFTVIENA